MYSILSSHRVVSKDQSKQFKQRKVEAGYIESFLQNRTMFCRHIVVRLRLFLGLKS